MLTTSAERTERNTPRSQNERILRRTEQSVTAALAQGPAAVERRLRELDAEWDTERTLETMAASFGLLGVALGATMGRKWYALSGVIAGFLLQHALQGWCPPLPVIRALGVRTAREIDAERFALKLARGDFQTEPYTHEPAALVVTQSVEWRELDLVSPGTLAGAASGG